MSVAKIVEIVGSSDKGWEDAEQVAVEDNGLCCVHES